MRERIRQVVLYLVHILTVAAIDLPAVLIVIAICSGRFEYQSSDGFRTMRAWHVPLPGYATYLDLNADPPVKRRYFTMCAKYRVSPWIKAEWDE